MPSTTRRRAGALLVLAVLVCSIVPPVAAAAAPASDAIADKHAEAERIARQLEQQSRRVSILAEDYDAARVKIESLEVELEAAGAQVAKTDAEARRVRARLKEQSVEAYMRGGSAPALALLADAQITEDIAVRAHYVHTVTAGAADVLDELRVVRQELDIQRDRLDDARAEARAVAALAESKKQEAAAAVAAQQRTLQEVQGELAALVEAEAKRRAEEEARRVQAELAARRAHEAAAAREAAAREAAAAREEAARRAATTTAPARVAGPVATTRPPTTSTTAPRTTTTTPPSAGSGSPAAGADAAIAEARRQLGKPYEWGGAGPDTFDCSGLTSWAWRAGGKRLSHSSRAQWSETSRVAIENLQPGDLLFYGDPIHHVGLFIGNGEMIEAPETGKNVRIATIYRRDLVGVGRVN